MLCSNWFLVSVAMDFHLNYGNVHVRISVYAVYHQAWTSQCSQARHLGTYQNPSYVVVADSMEEQVLDCPCLEERVEPFSEPSTPSCLADVDEFIFGDVHNGPSVCGTHALKGG